MATRERAEGIFMVALLALLGYLTFLIFRPFLDWIILGFLFAYLFYKPYRGALKVLRRRGLAAGAMLVGVLVAFFLPFVLVAALLVRDVTSFADFLRQADLQALLFQALAGLGSIFGIGADSPVISNAADTISTAVRNNAGAFLTNFAADLFALVAKILIGLVIFGFTIFYGFVDGPRIIEGILSVIPLHRPEKERLLQEIQSVTNAVFIGHLSIALIQASLGTLGFLILGVPRAFLWGFVMLVAALIPFVGAVAVWLPIGLYLLFTDGAVNGLISSSRAVAAWGVLLFVGPIVSTIDNLLRPKLVGARAGIHPFLVLVGALGGLLVLGFTGFVVGPLVLSLFVASLRVWRTHWAETETPHVPPDRPLVPRKPKKTRTG